MRKSLFLLCMTALLCFITNVTALGDGPLELKDGDIVFQTSLSAQSLAIQRATHSKYSHMGIVFIEGGKPYVYEAVQPVKKTPLDAWIMRGQGGHVVAKRIKGKLSSKDMAAMRKVARGYLGKNYDLYFGWSDERIYCSELVWKVYKNGAGLEIGQLKRLKDFDLSDKAVRGKLAERYGKHIPYEETVISPADMFDSELLATVYEK